LNYLLLIFASNFVPSTVDDFFLIDPNLQILGLFAITGGEVEGRTMCEQICYYRLSQAAHSHNSQAMAVPVVTQVLSVMFLQHNYTI